MTKMAVEFFSCMPIRRMWTWEWTYNLHFCTESLWKSCSQSVDERNGGRAFLIHAYTAYVSVEKIPELQFLYGLPIGKLLVINRWQKWRPSFSRTCLYSLCERGNYPTIAIFEWNFYGKVVGNQSRTEMAAEFFSYVSIQRMWAWKNTTIAIFVWTFYRKVVSDQSKTKMAVEFFSYMPIWRMWAWE